jgi:hypothetical protein
MGGVSANRSHRFAVVPGSDELRWRSNRETAMKKISIIGVLMGAAIVCAIPISLNWSADKGLSVSENSAEARIGRPLTPGSIAGVNRRVHRRAYRRCAYGVTCY